MNFFLSAIFAAFSVTFPAIAHEENLNFPAQELFVGEAGGEYVITLRSNLDRPDQFEDIAGHTITVKEVKLVCYLPSSGVIKDMEIDAHSFTGWCPSETERVNFLGVTDRPNRVSGGWISLKLTKVNSELVLLIKPVSSYPARPGIILRPTTSSSALADNGAP